VRILIIGLGSIAKKHVDVIRQIDNDSIIYALRSKKDAKKVSGIINLYSIDDLICIKIDFAIISNPTSEHKKTIDCLISYKFPLFIEKPVSSSLNITEAIEKINANNILTYVACDMRFLDVLNYVKEYLCKTKSRINEVNVYCGSYLPDWRPNTDFRTVYSAQKELGGGVHLDLIHEFDYIYWIFGTPDNVTKVIRNKSSLNIDAFDYANYILLYEKFSVSIILNYYRRDYKRTFEIVFEDKTWLIDLHSNKIFCDDKEIFYSDENPQDCYLKQMVYFMDLVKNKRHESFNSIIEANNVLKICL